MNDTKIRFNYMDFDGWKLIRLTLMVVLAGFLQHWLTNYSKKEKRDSRLNKNEITDGDFSISRWMIIVVILSIVYTIYAMYMTHHIYGVPIQIMGCGLVMISVIPMATALAICIGKPTKKISNILNAIFLQDNVSPRKAKLAVASLSLFGLFIYMLAWFDLAARGGTLQFLYLFPVCM